MRLSFLGHSKASVMLPPVAWSTHGPSLPHGLVRKDNMFEAQRTGQIDGASNNPIKLINEGRIHYRDIPVQQSLEDWNDFWSEYKSS